MKIKEFLKNFFRPAWKKIFFVLFLEFIFTFTLLSLDENLPEWIVYLISPNVIYLETFIDPLTITQYQLAFHGAVANVIALIYLYFLSCVIIRITEIGRRK